MHHLVSRAQWTDCPKIGLTPRSKFRQIRRHRAVNPWVAQQGMWGTISPTFGTTGVQGIEGRAVQWKWSLLLQQTVFIQYCTNDWISTPLTDICLLVPHIWKGGVHFFRSFRSRILFCTHLEIRGAAHVSITRQYCNIFCVLCIRPKSDLCWCQLVHTPVSSAVEVENASILDTDVTAVFTAETAPTKSAVCIYTLICNYLWLINAPTYWNPRILHTGRLVSSRWTDEWMSFLRDKVISNVSADTAPRFNNSSRLNHPRP